MSDTNIQALLGRLRAVSETGCDPDLPYEAASAIEALLLVRNALDAELAEMKRMTGIALMCNHVARMERAEAKLAELEGQEPFDVDDAHGRFREAFEATLKHGNWPLTRKGHGYRSPMTQMAWDVAFGTVNRLKLYIRPAPAEQPVNARLTDEEVAEALNIFPMPGTFVLSVARRIQDAVFRKNGFRPQAKGD